MSEAPDLTASVRPMDEVRLKLIYVASVGRSGSTLIESVLGAHSQVDTLGEIHALPHELLEDVKPCACGRPVSDCPLWECVAKQTAPLSQSAPGLDYFRENYNGGRTLRPTVIARLIMARFGRRNPDQSRLETYAQNNRAVFAAFRAAMREQHGHTVEWVVDASKDAYRLAWFAASDQFDLKVVHVVRDPRAYAYSVTGYLSGSTCADTVLRLWKTVRQTAAWIVQNILVSSLVPFGPDRYLRVRYEDFATDPHASFHSICDFVGIPYQAEAVERFREGSVHTIAGNPMRYESRPIALDERWRTRLPRSSRAVVDVMTVAFRHRFGYGRGLGPSTLSSHRALKTTERPTSE